MLALPTYRERFPAVIAEASGLGLPIRFQGHSRRRGPSRGGREHLFVSPRRHDHLAHHLARALRRLLNNLGRCADRGERNGREDSAPRLVVPHYVGIIDSTDRG